MTSKQIEELNSSGELWLDHLSSAAALDSADDGKLRRASNLMFPLGLYEEARLIFDDVIATSDSEQAKLIASLGVVETEFLSESNHGMGINALERLLPDYDGLRARFGESNDGPGEAFTLQRCSWILASLRRLEEAHAAVDRAREIAEAAGDQYTIGYCHYDLALILTMEKRYSDALAELTSCEAVRSSIGDYHGVGAARIGISKVEGAQGQFGKAVASMQSATDIFGSLNNRYVVGAVSTHMAALAADYVVTATKDSRPSDRGLDRIVTDIAEFTLPQLTRLETSVHEAWPG